MQLLLYFHIDCLYSYPALFATELTKLCSMLLTLIAWQMNAPHTFILQWNYIRGRLLRARGSVLSVAQNTFNIREAVLQTEIRVFTKFIIFIWHWRVSLIELRISNVNKRDDLSIQYSKIKLTKYRKFYFRVKLGRSLTVSKSWLWIPLHFEYTGLQNGYISKCKKTAG